MHKKYNWNYLILLKNGGEFAELSVFTQKILVI